MVYDSDIYGLPSASVRTSLLQCFLRNKHAGYKKWSYFVIFSQNFESFMWNKI